MERNGQPKVVAVTGAAGYIGRRLLERLATEYGIERIVATDTRPLDNLPAKITYLQQDITQPLSDAFREHGVEVVVHLSFVLRQSRHRDESHRVNVDGTANVLQASHIAGVRRIIQLSSATVYGPHPDNPALLTEEHLMRPPYAFQYAWDKAECERLIETYVADHPDTDVSVLRGSVVMGPSARNFITSALFKPLMVGIRGCDPPMQFIHEEDLVELLWRFVAEPHPGIYNVAGRGSVRWSELARMARRRFVWLPASVIYGITELTWRLRLQNDSPSVGLDFVRWPWTVSTKRVEQETGYTCKFTSEEALGSFLDTR
jgi:UDP-glucose 4-epimerase